MVKTIINKIWLFIRGDLSTGKFEKWLYNWTELEDLLGKNFYLEIISTDFKSAEAIYFLKKELEVFLRKNSPLICECLALADLAITDFGSEQEGKIFDAVKPIKFYGNKRWWLSIEQCNKCHQYWLIAQDCRINDINCFKRLKKSEAENIIHDDVWPAYFETLEEIFRIGKNNGKAVWRFVDSMDESLRFSVEDMIKIISKS
jgi:hypothetical protein